jgi:subtilisin family serine protease
MNSDCPSNQTDATVNRKSQLIVAVPNDTTGNSQFDSLQKSHWNLRSLSETLEQLGVPKTSLTRIGQMKYRFGFIAVKPGDEFKELADIYRWLCEVKLFSFDIMIEPDSPGHFSPEEGIGTDFKLEAEGSSHSEYLDLLRVSNANVNGDRVKIGVLDSGFAGDFPATGFLDLVEPSNQTSRDRFGHGTAMASIIHSVADKAEIYSIRIADRYPYISDVMLGSCAAAFRFAVNILHLSGGVSQGAACSCCNHQYTTSQILQRFLGSLMDSTAADKTIFIAATGNDGRSTGFDLPAKLLQIVAVSSINQNLKRSTFSNYGTKNHHWHIAMPGGDAALNGKPNEWAGKARVEAFGTSVSAAYASGIIALYISDPDYAWNTSTRDAFLDTVLRKCDPCNEGNPDMCGKGYLPYQKRY